MTSSTKKCSMRRCSSCLTLQSQSCLLSESLASHAQSSLSKTTTITKQCDNYDDLEPTSLYLLGSSPTGVAEAERLYLPTQRRCSAPASLDVYLQSIPSVASRANELFHADASLEEAATCQRCLNVLQGEVAHATPSQTDLLVSAEATTCHVVALRSYRPGSTPLSSMAHIDQAGVYDQCLEKMVLEHVEFHAKQLAVANEDDFGFYMGDAASSNGSVLSSSHPQEGFLPQAVSQSSLSSLASTSPASISTASPELIAMDLHIVGGYLDHEGTSQELSTSLIQSFCRLASKYQEQVRMSLKTVAMSSLNTSLEEKAPKSRGLALNTHTGEVFPVTSALPPSLEGPALELRSARLFSNQQQQAAADNMTRTASLAVIHTPSSREGTITIEPFDYQPMPQLEALLQVPDELLLQLTSTSPLCESSRFCNDMRRTLSFVTSTSSDQIFAQAKPLQYSRSRTNVNEWLPVSTAQETITTRAF